MNGVDVVIPCYNYARFLPSAVNSVLNQDGVNVRVLIIDDASPDNTREVGEELARRDGRVEYRRHAVNRGHISSYNEGLLEWASAEYSLMLSADDMVAPGALARAAAVMDRHPDVGLTYGMARVISADDAEHPAGSDSEEYQIIPGTEFLRRCFEKGNAVETPTAVVRTAVQQRLGGYLATLPHSGDMEMWMRFAVHGPVGVLRAVQGYVRVHGANMSDRYYGQLLRDRREIVGACEEILTRWGAQFPDSARWRVATMDRLAEESYRAASRAFDAGDLAACQAAVDFAAEIQPRRWRSPTWWRVETRRLVGPGAWNNLRRVWRRSRRRAANTLELSTVSTRFAQVSGWWPER
jgi:glycosyltransferase involved in cell wall biosynthesis